MCVCVLIYPKYLINIFSLENSVFLEAVQRKKEKKAPPKMYGETIKYSQILKNNNNNNYECQFSWIKYFI